VRLRSRGLLAVSIPAVALGLAAETKLTDQEKRDIVAFLRTL
jgi:hypothetical protein